MNPTPSQLIFVYGPPGSGKTSTGRHLGLALHLAFIDLDQEITLRAGRSIPEIFAREGEPGFRALESAVLHEACGRGPAVVALGGGTLMNAANRTLAEEAGCVICLSAPQETLVARLSAAPEGARPLLGQPGQLENRLAGLMAARGEHYASFPTQVDTTGLTPAQAGWAAQVHLGRFHITGMGRAYDVLVQPGLLDPLGELLQARGLKGPIALVTDAQVAPLHAARAEAALVAAGYGVSTLILPAGEAAKTLSSASRLWEGFLSAGLERGSTVVALGGGVIGDLTGFAASAYLRGVRWVAVPTTLLSMVDASLGGKTAIDLPQGKNLVGAFHPPALVAADPELLRTLPEAEMRNGMAEVIKHGILRDPGLFDLCARGWQSVQAGDWAALVRRAVAVKVLYILADPYEKGERAALNLGHTIGHGVEQASNFSLRHGEAVAVGLAAATRLAVRQGVAQPELVAQIDAALDGLGLPRHMPPGMDAARVLALMQNDKKKHGGQLRFVLPERIGAARFGVALDLDMETLREVTQ